MESPWFRWGAGAAMVLTVAACLAGLPRLVFEPGLRLEASDPTSPEAIAEGLFPTPLALFLTVPVPRGSAFTTETLDALVTLSDDLEKAGFGSWRGPWDVSLPQDGDWVPLWSPGQQGDLLAAKLHDAPSLRPLLLGADDTSWLLSSDPTGGTPDIEALETWLEARPGVLLGGQAWYDREFDRLIRRDAIVLFPLSLLLLIGLFALVTRTWFGVVSLGLGAMMPAVGVLALFAWAAIPMGYASLLAPILVLALSTVYSLHGYHHTCEGGTPATLWKSRGRAIFWSGLTASSGFATLLLSPVTDLRRLGFVILVGMALSLIWNLWLLPRFLAPLFSHSSEPRLSPLPKHRWWQTGVLFLILLAALPGLGMLATGIHWSAYFSPGESLGQRLSALEARVGDRSQATLVLSWKEDGGWLEGDRWLRLARHEAEWREAPGVSSVSGLAGLVVASLAAQGSDVSQESIGEALELLPRPRPAERLIDGRRSSVALRFSWQTRDAEGAAGMLRRFENLRRQAEAAFPGVQAAWTGPLYRESRAVEAFVQGQIFGMAGYFLLVGFVAWARLRRWKTALWVLVPPVSAGIVLLGLMGWLGWAITPPLALVISEIAGVGTDDALLWAMLERDTRLRRALAQSTFILVGGLSILLLSGFSNIVQIGIGGMVALTFSTLMVLWVLPWSDRSSSFR